MLEFALYNFVTYWNVPLNGAATYIELWNVVHIYSSELVHNTVRVCIMHRGVNLNFKHFCWFWGESSETELFQNKMTLFCIKRHVLYPNTSSDFALQSQHVLKVTWLHSNNHRHKLSLKLWMKNVERRWSCHPNKHRDLTHTSIGWAPPHTSYSSACYNAKTGSTFSFRNIKHVR